MSIFSDFDSLPSEAYPKANAIGASLADSLKDLLVLKGVISEEDNGLLKNQQEDIHGEVAEALCLIREVFNV